MRQVASPRRDSGWIIYSSILVFSVDHGAILELPRKSGSLHRNYEEWEIGAACYVASH